MSSKNILNHIHGSNGDIEISKNFEWFYTNVHTA